MKICPVHMMIPFITTHLKTTKLYPGLTIWKVWFQFKFGQKNPKLVQALSTEVEINAIFHVGQTLDRLWILEIRTQGSHFGFLKEENMRLDSHWTKL